MDGWNLARRSIHRRLKGWWQTFGIGATEYPSTQSLHGSAFSNFLQAACPRMEWLESQPLSGRYETVILLPPASNRRWRSILSTISAKWVSQSYFYFHPAQYTTWSAEKELQAYLDHVAPGQVWWCPSKTPENLVNFFGLQSPEKTLLQIEG